MKLLSYMVLLISMIGYFTAEGRQVCQMNQQTIMQDVSMCMFANPKLAGMIATHMNDLKGLESAEFLCDYKEAIADLFVCLEHKLADCVPEQAQLLSAILPKKSNLMDGFQLLCENKEVMHSDCFDTQYNSFMQCYMSNLKMLSTHHLVNVKDPHKIVCSVIRAEEQCFKENKGTCSDKFIKLIFQLLETVFPMKNCPKVSALDNLMGSILVRGQPLHFQPNTKQGYIIKN